MKPSVGRIVHYVSYGSPGGEYVRQCRAAIVADVAEETGAVDLVVFNPKGIFFNRVPYHDGADTPGDPNCPESHQHRNPWRFCSCGWMEGGYPGGTWHWPEREED